jgi:hypothetical protein
MLTLQNNITIGYKNFGFWRIQLKGWNWLRTGPMVDFGFSSVEPLVSTTRVNYTTYRLRKYSQLMFHITRTSQ